MTEHPQAGSDDEDTEGHRRFYADQESTEGDEDTGGHRRFYADQESTEGGDSEV